MQPFTETQASERRRLGNRSRREGSGGARDGTVSRASHRTASPWALYTWESSAIMRVCIIQQYWHVATRVEWAWRSEERDVRS